MWSRIINRAGRALLSIAAAGAAQYVTQSPYALLLAPLMQALGKWMRERGFQNVPL